MPGIITHLAYANRYLKRNPQWDFKKFILGAIFPDVRYFAKVEKNLTHRKFKPELNLARLDDFSAGWKLHIYLDHQWNKFVKNSVYYGKYKSDIRVAGMAAKIIEDALDSKKIDNLPNIIKVLRNPGAGTALHIPSEKVKFYYAMSVDYVITKNHHNYMKFVFLGDSLIDKVDKKIEEIKKDQEAIDFLAGILDKLSP